MVPTAAPYRPLLLALLVVLAGCSMVPGWGDEPAGPDPDTGPPDHHLAFLSSSVQGYNATVTVSKDGTRVSQHNVSFEDDAIRYVPLTTLNESGTYTITVETDIPGVGGGTMDETHRLEVDPGPAETIVHTTFTDIAFVTGPDTGRSVEVPIQYSWSHPHAGHLSYEVSRENTTVESVTRTPKAFAEPRQTAGTLQTTGVHWVVVNTNRSDNPSVAVGVVNQSTEMVLVQVDTQGDITVSFPQQTDESDEWVS